MIWGQRGPQKNLHLWTATLLALLTVSLLSVWSDLAFSSPAARSGASPVLRRSVVWKAFRLMLSTHGRRDGLSPVAPM